MDRKKAAAQVAEWAAGTVEESDRETFREVAENELLGLHKGNFARYATRPGGVLRVAGGLGPAGLTHRLGAAAMIVVVVLAVAARLVILVMFSVIVFSFVIGLRCQ